MAQVYYGEVQASTYILLSVVVDEDRSTFGQSKLTITLRGRRTNSYSGNTGNLTGTFTVSGGMSGSSSALFLIPPYNNDWIYFTHITTTIYHTDAQAVNFSWSSSAGTHLSGSGSGSFTLARFPQAPTISTFTVANITNDSAVLSADLSSYGTGSSGSMEMFYRKTGTANWTSLGTQTDTSSPRTWDVSGLTANSKYDYQVKAWNNYNDISYSAINDFITSGWATVTITNLLATSLSINVAQVAGDQAVPQAQPEYKEATAENWQTLPAVTSLTPTFSVTGLTPNTDYLIRVKITNVTTRSIYTPNQTVKTLPACLIIKPNGTAINAIPYLIKTNGTVIQLDPKIIRKN